MMHQIEEYPESVFILTTQPFETLLPPSPAYHTLTQHTEFNNPAIF